MNKQRPRVKPGETIKERDPFLTAAHTCRQAAGSAFYQRLGPACGAGATACDP